jgi:DNA-binding CsgD family transcriptional regulator
MQGVQICHYLAKGLSMKEVSVHLAIPRGVLDARLKNLRRKYNCNTTYQLMAVLAARGIVKESRDE